MNMSDGGSLQQCQRLGYLHRVASQLVERQWTVPQARRQRIGLLLNIPEPARTELTKDQLTRSTIRQFAAGG
jgi:hypothetical protein